MSEGLIIMAVGMGVVFLFLIILMLFIHLLGLATRENNSGARVGPQATGDDMSDRERDEGAQLAAAVAVALELSRRRPPRPQLNQEPSGGENGWQRSGRELLHKGPALISAIRTGSRGGR